MPLRVLPGHSTATKQEFVNGTKRDTSGIKGNNLTGNVTLSWTLFDGLKMFATRNKIASIRDLGELAIKDQVQNSISTIIGGYYNIVQPKATVESPGRTDVYLRRTGKIV